MYINILSLVTIVSPKPFRGFLLQARTSLGDTIVGSFEDIPSTAKTLDCSGAKDAITHRRKEDKMAVRVTWRSPATTTGEDITFL